MFEKLSNYFQINSNSQKNSRTPKIKLLQKLSRSRLYFRFDYWYSQLSASSFQSLFRGAERACDKIKTQNWFLFSSASFFAERNCQFFTLCWCWKRLTSTDDPRRMTKQQKRIPRRTIQKVASPPPLTCKKSGQGFFLCLTCRRKYGFFIENLVMLDDGRNNSSAAPAWQMSFHHFWVTHRKLSKTSVNWFMFVGT